MYQGIKHSMEEHAKRPLAAEWSIWLDNYKIYAAPFKIVQWCMSINFNKTGKNIRDTTPLDSWQMLGDKASMSLFVSW